MSNVREKSILQFLLEHKERFVTSRELAEHLSCSDRTVRNHLKAIDQTMSVPGVNLVSKQGQGYRLTFDNQQAFQALRTSYELGETLTSHSPSQTDDRLAIILNKLLFEQSSILFDDLADELYVSRSTLSHDFKKIRQILADYSLTIESRANKGVYVSGNERDKRRFIMDYFLGNQLFQTLHDYVNPKVIDQMLSLEDLARIVLEECQDAQLKLSDFVLQNLVVHIALSLERIKLGFELSAIDWQIAEAAVEQAVAKKILTRVEQLTHQAFPEQEVDYITLHLLAKGQLEQTISEEVTSEGMKDLLRRSFQKLGLDNIYHFSSDFQLMESLVAHLMTLQVRLTNHIVLTNPLADEVKQEYGDVFFLAKEVLSQMEPFAQDSLSDDEVAYVALHFMAAIERRKEASRYSVLAICASGFGAAQMLKNRLETEFGNRIKVVDVIGYYELNPDKVQGIDFIVSAVDLSHLYFAIPVFTVSVFLKPEEISILRQAMDKLQEPHSNLVGSLGGTDSGDLGDLLSAENLYLWTGNDKEKLLDTMVSGLCRGESAQFKPDMLQSIRQREDISSVVFSEKIAVPHPIRPLSHNAKVAVALCQQPIAWDDMSSTIRIVFLLSPSLYGNEELTRLSQKIVALTENTALQNELMACQDIREVIKLLEKI